MRVFIVGVQRVYRQCTGASYFGRIAWSVVGIDLYQDNIADLQFLQGDLTQEQDWMESQIQRCDILIPLAAIATPKSYIADPWACLSWPSWKT